jgi:hypothetical protein
MMPLSLQRCQLIILYMRPSPHTNESVPEFPPAVAPKIHAKPTSRLPGRTRRIGSGNVVLIGRLQCTDAKQFSRPFHLARRLQFN